MHTPVWLRLTGRTLNQNSPAIFTGLAVAGVAATAVLAVRATIKAAEHMQFAKATPRETVEECWRFYIPATLAGLSTVACIVAANQAASRRQAALLSAYTMADTAFREYKNQVAEEFGEARARKVDENRVARKIDENPPKDDQVIITGRGDTLCYEDLTGRYFRGNIEDIRRIANDINAAMLGGDMYASLNEFYVKLGLAPVTLGDELGFNLENLIDLIFTSHLAQDGDPCLAIRFGKLPIKEYTKF